MKRLLASWLAAALLLSCRGAAQQGERLVDAPGESPKGAGRAWPSQPPAACPFKPSETLTGVVFTGRKAAYTGADTWYPSWA